MPENGVYIHGLFSDGFRWDEEKMEVEDSIPGIMNSVVPMLHMDPKMDFTPPIEDYIAPLYKTSARAGVLSTTGIHSLCVFCSQYVFNIGNCHYNNILKFVSGHDNWNL